MFFQCSFGIVLNWSLPPFIIFSKVWFTFFEDHYSGYWFLVQQVLLFSRTWSKANQLEVALNTLWTVPWVTFFLCWSVAQLQKFGVIPVSVGFWCQWQVILLLMLTFMLMSIRAKSLSMLLFSKAVCRLLCNEFANFKYSSGSPRPMQIISSTELLNNFIASYRPTVCGLQ